MGWTTPDCAGGLKFFYGQHLGRSNFAKNLHEDSFKRILMPSFYDIFLKVAPSMWPFWAYDGILKTFLIMDLMQGLLRKAFIEYLLFKLKNLSKCPWGASQSWCCTLAPPSGFLFPRCWADERCSEQLHTSDSRPRRRGLCRRWRCGSHWLTSWCHAQGMQRDLRKMGFIKFIYHL